MSTRTLSCYLSLAVLAVAISMLAGCADWAAALATAPMSQQMQASPPGTPPSLNSVLVCEGGLSGSRCTRHSIQELREALSRQVPGY